jgi:hypothetical protein
VVGVLRNRSNLRHYMQNHPYLRLLNRVRRMLDEARATRDFSTGRQCLDRLYSTVLPDTSA